MTNNPTEHDIASTLNQLIETCMDGKEGFTAAAEAVSDSTLRRELLDLSQQREEFAADLQSHVALLGEKPEQKGSVSGALHRGWINIKAAINTRDKYAVLSECERGEDSAVDAYRHALQVDLPMEESQTIALQYAAIKRAHDRIKTLRDASKSETSKPITSFS